MASEPVNANLTTFPDSEYFNVEPAMSFELNSNLTIEQLRALLNPANYPSSYKNARDRRHSVIIAFYATIVLISLFGNLFVCYVITKRRRMRTKCNLLMCNMAVSDLFLTCFSIPMTVARILLNEWPFGSILCIAVPLVQVTSVYVSTFTMGVIAVDRYQAIINPLHKRLTTSVPISAIIFIIWLASLLFAVPNVAFNRVVEIPVQPLLHRCRAVYPSNELTYRQNVTLFTFITQYALPLSITAFAYIRISFYVWKKLPEPTESCSSASTLSTEKVNHNGQQEYMEQSMPSVPHSQLSSLKRTCFYPANVTQLREKSRRKSIKMLILVVVCFAVTWMPLNVYHLNTDFSSSDRIIDPMIFFVCHWFAMSSVCYNSFIYFYLNRHYRQEIQNLTRCALPCFPTEEAKLSYDEPHHQPDHLKRKQWLKNGAVCQTNKEIVVQDSNNNNHKRICTNHSPKVGYATGTRVRYCSEKPANCKIMFRSRYNNVPVQMSSSSSGHSTSSMKKGKCKLQRSNAVRMSANSQSVEASSNRSNANAVFNSMASSDSNRGSDI